MDAPVPNLSAEGWLIPILASQGEWDVAPGQLPRRSRPMSLDNLPSIDQHREVEANDVHL
jgi:hypothetical protein